MTRRLLLIALAGLLAGAVAAVAVLLLLPDDEPRAAVLDTVAISTTTTAPAAIWVDADEVALGPTVMVVEGLAVEEGEAVLSFDLFDISPVLPGTLREPDWLTTVALERLADEAAVAPEAWTLITAAGEIPGATSSPRARTARFELPGGVLPEVLGVRLDRYWMRIPYSYQAALPLNGPATLDTGSVLGVARVVEQTDSKIVQLDLSVPGGFAISTDPGAVFLALEGEEWSFISGRTATGLQVVHDAGPLPDPIWFIARSAYWVPFDRPVLIPAEVMRLE